MSEVQVWNLLRDFLFSDLGKTLNQCLRRDPNLFWREMHKYDKWRDLSSLALHFVTLPTSEADVERLFSRQKQVMTPYSPRMRLHTLDARLRLHKQSHANHQ